MKKHLVLLLLLLVPTFSFGQDDKYQSREEDEYNKNYKYKHFEPMTEVQIKLYKNDFFNFERIENFTPYNASLFMLTYLDFPISYQDSVLHTENNAWFENTPRFIGQINKHFILRYEKKRSDRGFCI